MEKVKLPRSSYEELRKIITAYGSLNKPAGLTEIQHVSGINPTVVSANNAFLSLIGIIEGGNKKVITPKGLSLSRALEHEIVEEIQRCWSVIVDESDFLTKMLQAVRIRKGMDGVQLENHIAFSSGEQKTREVLVGARTVINILLASGRLTQDGDKFLTLLSSSGRVQITERLDVIDILPEQPKLEREVRIDQASSGIKLNIDLRITATPDQLEGLGQKIKALLDELNAKN